MKLKLEELFGKAFAPPTGKFCRECEARLAPAAAFCGNCGTKV
jgi:predicted amidophosphoribosyltransferase